MEISGEKWANSPFKSYKNLYFPQFDICREIPEKKHGTYDLIIAEQVFEHLTQPQKAAKNIYSMLRKNGHFLIPIPFLIKRHDAPIDCSRWTNLGLKYFLNEAGFKFENIHTESWGNKACVIANLAKWVIYNKYIHSLKNDETYPIVVWGFCKK